DPANSLPATQAVTIDNNALMTGYVTLWDGAGHTFNNNGTFAVRHFADTNGDGLRDTKAVSVSDFGGPNSSFNNSGTVRFAPVANAPATDATGYYVPTTGADSRPLEAGFYDLNREGLVQGQFVNLQTFNNSGTIDLRGPEIGNTLVMTSNPTAGGAPGTGTFVTNGGQLLVNTRLNDGIAPGGAANSYSDMLIVDRTQMGSAPTAIGVSYDPAVAGALTPGNGIEIVEVRDKANSAAGVFTLGNRVAGSAYEYRLYHNGVGADAADGNWYLRSTRIPDPETPPPAPGPDPDPGQSPGPGPTAPDKPVELPDYRVEVPVDAIVPALASRLGMTMIGTLDDRYGPDFAPFSEQPPAPAPAREIWCKDAARNFRCTPTPQQNAYYAGVDQQAPLPAGHLFWARVFGQFGAHNAGGRSDMDRLNAFERNGASYGYRMGGIQFGAHLYRDPLNTAGVYVGYGRIGATVDTVYGEGRAGSVAMDAYSLGGYWTHRRPGGWYVDTVLQGTLYGAISATSVLGESLATRGWGFAASLETGHPVALGAGWTITPQLQAIYQTVGIDGGA
ncbi:autotransporter outer membrane beta-barrel domain-containing protein, partial [Phreatobacter sp. AB_2022a]|uniref:autotransporter outer membrane beta-barrel domain-containing protein n=1 Tax=Phreatobacter sp. AB_2022a TaxID=3003134 RepID=UPI0022872D2C